MTRPQSRTARWHDAVAAARAALDAVREHADALEAAMSDLRDVRDEYAEWRDNLPDGLASSPVGEKLDAIADMDLDIELDLDAIEGMIDEAEGADLPLGFGRD